jgi:hypothetical protein
MNLRRSDAAILAATAAAVVFGVWLNPFLTTWLEREQTALGIVVVAAMAAIALEVFRTLRMPNGSPLPRANEPLTPDPSPARGEGSWIATPPTLITYPTAVGFWLVLLAWAVLYRFPWMTYRFYADDLRYIKETGSTWSELAASLFVPFNEHLVPVTRLVTFLLGAGAEPFGGDTRLPAFFGAYNAWLFVGTCSLLFLLLHRIGGGLGALVGLSLFAVSLCHSEIVLWYSAAQWLVPACLLLGSLLVVERDSKRSFAWATLFSALAPWNYSLGAVVGPFTSIWLLGWHRRWRWSSLLPAVVGVASTAVVAMIVRQSMQQERYWESGGKGMIEAFDPWMGLIYSARLFADRLILTNLGYRGPAVSMTVAAIIVALIGMSIVWAIRCKPEFSRLWPTAAFIVLGYGVAIPFRAWVQYEWIVDWNRYQLIPLLGLSMLAAGIVGSFPRLLNASGWKPFAAFAVGLILWTVLQDVGWMNR